MAKDISENARAVMSANGRIEYLLMVYDGRYQKEYFDILLELLRKMPYYTRFIVYCVEEGLLLNLSDFLSKNNFYDFLKAPSHTRGEYQPKCLLVSPPNGQFLKFSKWIRDAFFVKWDARKRLVHLSETAPNNPVINCLEESESGTPGIRRVTEFNDLGIEGGNVLLVDKYILVGYIEVHKRLHNPDLPAIDKTELVRRLKKLFNTCKNKPFEKVVFVGEKLIPALSEDSALDQDKRTVTAEYDRLFAHLDMFLTVTGVEKNKKPVILLAQAEQLFTLGISSKQEQNILKQWNRYTDIIKKELEPHFEVERNPVPLFLKYKSEIQNDVLMATPKMVYTGAYNNCLVEAIDKDARNVWLPRLSIAPVYTLHQSALKKIEDSNKRIWEKLGFKVHFIKADFHGFLQAFGALHCLTIELARNKTSGQNCSE